MKESLTTQLSQGLSQFTQFTRLKRDWRYCPRCRARAINRDARRCDACHGRVLFQGDTASQVIEDWFMWYHGAVTGWYHRSFFTAQQLTVPEGWF